MATAGSIGGAHGKDQNSCGTCPPFLTPSAPSLGKRSTRIFLIPRLVEGVQLYHLGKEAEIFG